MKKPLIALVLVTGCGGPAQPGNDAAAGGNGVSPEAAARDAVGQAVATARLTGLYEGGEPGRPNQLCIVDRGTGDARFGIIVWGAGLRSCSGAGDAVREGGRLRLRMAGDEACVVEARIDGGTVTLADTIPEGCGYYCAAPARFEGAVLARRGSTAEDAMKAKDLVGDPLCEG
jgi:hypothetical protein